MVTVSCVSGDQRGQQLDEVENLLLEVRAGPVVKLLSSHVGRKPLRTDEAGQPVAQVVARGPC